MNINLLIADDDETALFIANKFLSKERGFTIFTADCVRKGLEIIENERIDAIISDYQMDEQTGLDFLQEIRKSGLKTPVIIFTAHSREEIAIKALNLGANYYVKKEGNTKSQFIELAHLVRTAVSHRRAEIQLKRAYDELERRVTKRTLELVEANRQLQDEIMERAKTEKALEESMKRIKEKDVLLTTIFETTPDLIFVKDAQFRYVMVNKAYADFYQRKPEEIIGKTFQDLGERYRTKAETTRVRKQDKEILERKKAIFIPEQEITDPNGSLRWFQTTKYPIETSEYPNAILGISVDITENKLAADIIAKRLKYEKALSQCSKYLLTTGDEEFSPLRKTLDLLIHAMSLERGYIFNIDEEMGGIRLEEEIFHDESLSWRQLLDSEHFIGGKTISKELQQLMKGLIIAGSVSSQRKGLRRLLKPVANGHVILLPIFMNQECTAILGLDTREDVSWAESDIRLLRTVTEMIGAFLENRQATESLKKSETKYRRLHDTMKQGVVYFDQDLRIVSANQAAMEILNIDEEDLVGKKGDEIDLDYINEEGQPVDPQTYSFRRALNTGQPVSNRVAGIRTEKGVKWISITSVPLFDGASDKPTQVHMIFEDITEHRKALSVKREREAFRIMMEEYSKTDSITDLSRNILDKLVILLEFSTGIVQMWDTTADILKPIAISGEHPYRDHISNLFSERIRVNDSEFLKIHSSVYISDFTNLDFERESHIQYRMDSGSYFGYCLFDSDEILIGYLAFTSTESRPATSDEQRSLETIAQMFRTVIEKRIAEDRISQNISRMRDIQKSLKQERDYLTTLHDAIADVVITVRLPSLEIEYINSRVRKIFGYNQMEIIGRSQDILFSDPSSAKRFEIFTRNASLTNGRSISTESLMKSKDGTIFPTEIITTVIEENGHPIKQVSIVRDITDRKRIEDLERTQMNLGIALAGEISLQGAFRQFTKAAIEVSNMEHGGIYKFEEGEGFILKYQEGLPKSFLSEATFFPIGSPQYELVMRGKPIYSSIKKLPIPIDDIREKLGLQATAIIPIVQKRGVSGCLIAGSTTMENIPVHAREALESIAALAGVVIARVQAEEQVKHSEDMFRKAFDSIPEPAYLWEKTPEDDIILRMVNKTVMDDSGGKMESLLGRRITEIYPNMPELTEAIQHTLATGENVRGEMPFDSKLGELNGWYIWSFAEPVDNLVLMIMTDITAHKHTHEVLTRQRTELSQFVHTMSHDLRNPLHNILGYVELLEDEYDEHYLERIKKMIKNMELLLEKSVKLADAGDVIGEENEVNLEQIVKQSAEGIVPDDVKLIIDSLPSVLCDKERVIQMCQNILLNAVEHGKPTEVKVTADEKEEVIDILFSNNGDPIQEDIREKIFKERVSTKTSGGFGLFIIKKIVEAHGWSITYDHSNGPTFRISIPREKITDY